MPTEPHSQKPLASTHLTPAAGDPGHLPSPEIPSEVGACGEFLRDGQLEKTYEDAPVQFRVTTVMGLG